MESNKKLEFVLENLINIINDAELNEHDILYILPRFMFSLGDALERGEGRLSSEEILTNYAKAPTFGTALMAQAIYMEESWAVKDKKTKGQDKEEKEKCKMNKKKKRSR